MPLFDSTYVTIGTSYSYNSTTWCPTISGNKEPIFGVAGKRESWIHDPQRYILVNDTPAIPLPAKYGDGTNWLYFWHYARGPASVSGITRVQDRSIAPVLFADGRATKGDFTLAIRSNADYPTEPQPDWYWYEPVP